MRRTCVGVLAVCILVLGLPAAASATPLSYTFDSDNQDWTQNQDQESTDFLPAGFESTGGNPGGHLHARDSGRENGCPDDDPCELLTFYSPTVTPLAANYNGLASFDLRSPDADPQFAAELLLLAGGDNYLDGLLPVPLNRDYNHLSIPLNEGANWSVCAYAGGSCAPPTQAQFKSLIGATDQVAVMVDVGGEDENGTGETYDLDNVILTEGAPTPATPTPPAQAKKKCKKKRAAAGKKCKKKRGTGGKKKGRARSIRG